LSFGAFKNEDLLAFTFNGIGEYHGIKTAYDTGTGTLKEYRGQGLAKCIFQHSLPFLEEAGIRQYLLEVLQHNEGAVALYKKWVLK
jgi:ribosomal protein S18 acetylase RimI-like enzyme